MARRLRGETYGEVADSGGLDHDSHPVESNPESVLDFEDNLLSPSVPSSRYLCGRCLSGSNLQKLDAVWAYQRLINKVMQRFTSQSHPWYEVNADGSGTEQAPASAAVKLLGMLLSPVVFPIYFFCVANGLFFGTPLISKIERPLEQYPKQRYSYKEIAWAVLHCIYYSWLGFFPWFYFLMGHYLTDTTPEEWFEEKGWPASNKRAAFRFSPLLVFSPWLCCMLASWRFTQGILSSSYNCSVSEINEYAKKDPYYGHALERIVQKLGGSEDELSYYPIFVSSEDTEPDLLPSWWSLYSTICIAVFHSMLPTFWYSMRYRTPVVPIHASSWGLVAWLTGTISAAVEAFLFFRSFADATAEFSDVVKQLQLFIYLGATYKVRHKPYMQKLFGEIVKSNDEYRRRHADNFRFLGVPVKVKYLVSPRACYHEDHAAQLPANHLEKRDELVDLHVRQVAFNFSRKDGVLLFRRFRRYVRTDIFNERKEVEQYINVSVIAIILMFATTLCAQRTYGQFTSVCLVFPFDIFVLSIHIFSSLSKCVQANECLFDMYERVLLSWKEQTFDQDTTFEGNDPNCKAMAWVWNTKNNERESLSSPFSDDSKPGPSSKPALHELRETLDLAASMERLLEDKQQILGFEVTKELRNRLMASLMSVLVAIASRHMVLIQNVFMCVVDTMFRICTDGTISSSAIVFFDNVSRNATELLGTYV